LFAGGRKIGELRSAEAEDDGFIGLALLNLFALTPARTAGLSESGEEFIAIGEGRAS
jgi:hypothetical protein